MLASLIEVIGTDEDEPGSLWMHARNEVGILFTGLTTSSTDVNFSVAFQQFTFGR